MTRDRSTLANTTRILRGATRMLLVAPLSTAIAVEFQAGDFDVSLDSQISIGTSIRNEDRNKAYISPGNGGTSNSNTPDDGNLNFEKGDAFSSIVKGTHEMNVSDGRVGLFLRGKWWNDFTLNGEKVPHGHAPTSNAANSKLDDSDFNNYAKFDGIALLDAFFYGSFDIQDKPLDLRLGRQVVSWGESTFIQGGVNTINPVDVSAFRRPGATLKEGLLPVSLMYANLGVTDNLSIEGFYQLKWEPTVLDGCGTYFSSADWAAEGCERLAYAGAIPDATNFAAGAVANRSADLEPDDAGQFGLASRYYSDRLDTEFSAYYTNTHSRTPFAGFVRSENGLPLAQGGDGTYALEYPEDIQMFGLSMSTTVKGWAVSGEISHRPKQPIQFNSSEILAAAVAGAPTLFNDRVNSTPLGSMVSGYDEFAVTQLQGTLIKTFDRALKASTVTLVAELGGTFVDDLPDLDVARYGRSPVFGVGSLTPAGDDEGYVTQAAWGYRLLLQANYPNAIGSVDLLPKLSWSHDVKGFSPEPAQQFQEGRQALSLGITGSYLGSYSAGVSMTKYLNNADFNTLSDRDFLSFTASMTF